MAKPTLKILLVSWTFDTIYTRHGSFNPIPTEGGPFGPEQPKTVWHVHSFMAGVTKIHDFVFSVSFWSQWSYFWKKNYEILKNWKKKIYRFDTKNLKIWVFFQKIILFLLESEFYLFLAFFEAYITKMYLLHGYILAD